jgi:hypothetical protein
MTQTIVTANEREWRVSDPDHFIGYRKRGKAILSVTKGREGRLHVFIRHESKGQRWLVEKHLAIDLKPDTAHSLREWLDTYAQDSEHNGGATNSPSKSLIQGGVT